MLSHTSARYQPKMLPALLLLRLPAAAIVRSGPLSVELEAGGNSTLRIAGEAPVRGAPLSVFVGGAAHTVANGGLKCGAPTATSGTDEHGAFRGAELRCTAGAATPAVFSWHAYAGRTPSQGKLLATLSLPEGASGTAAQGRFDVHQTSPAHFAPFPAWRIEGALNSSAFLCYGGDKAHLYSSHAFSGGGGGLTNTHGSCFMLGNGPATLLWPSTESGGMQALVAGPASSFHLNYHRKITDAAPAAQLLTAKLWYNEARGDATLCLSAGCDRTQTNSGYTMLSADEGTFNPSAVPPPGMPGGKGHSTPLFFSWSQANTDNWVTNSSAQPGPTYKNSGNPDGFVYSWPGEGRIALETYVNANGTHHVAAATAASKAWALAHGYTAQGTLGYLDAPAPSDLCAPHAGTDYVCCDLKQVNVSTPAECCAACKAEPACTAWKTQRQGGTCFLKQGALSNPVKVGSGVVMGFKHTPAIKPASKSAGAWGFGVSGDVLSVPAGFKQSTLLVHSGDGPNDAWDEWGSSMRAAHGTKKAADEDVFLAALTLWTDNGAATLGAAWKADPETVPPPVAPGPVGPDAHDLGPDVSYDPLHNRSFAHLFIPIRERSIV